MLEENQRKLQQLRSLANKCEQAIEDAKARLANATSYQSMREAEDFLSEIRKLFRENLSAALTCMSNVEQASAAAQEMANNPQYADQLKLLEEYQAINRDLMRFAERYAEMGFGNESEANNE